MQLAVPDIRSYTKHNVCRLVWNSAVCHLLFNIWTLIWRLILIVTVPDIYTPKAIWTYDIHLTRTESIGLRTNLLQIVVNCDHTYVMDLKFRYRDFLEFIHRIVQEIGEFSITTECVRTGIALLLFSV